MKIDTTKHTTDELIQALEEKVKATCTDTTTVFSLNITHQGVERVVTTTGPEYLRSQGISMKNLRGEWIK